MIEKSNPLLIIRTTHQMTRLFSVLAVGLAALLILSCSKPVKPEGFSSYPEAKVFCDAAIKGGDSAGIVKHTDVSNVPAEILSPLENACGRLLARVREMNLIGCDEVDREAYKKYKDDEFAKMTPNFQELERMAPGLKWNIEPEKYLIYHFEAKSNPATKLKITYGLFEKSGKWWLACSY